MAEAVLNFNEETIKKQGVVWNLYSKLYEGMRVAQTVDSPSINTVPIGEDGQADATVMAEINKKLEEYSEILMKNSAYLFASSIIDVIKGGGSGSADGGGLGYVIRTGDNMTGLLGALYGFQAGHNGTQIFETTHDVDNTPYANITGNLTVSQDTTLKGKLNLANTGVWFKGNQVLFVDNNKATLQYENINLNGRVAVDGQIQIGNLILSDAGITFGDEVFYNSTNANNKDTDWTMRNAKIYGNLNLQGDFVSDGLLIANNGFRFSLGGHKLMYTESEDVLNETGEPVLDEKGKQVIKPWITLQTDLKILNGYGLKLGDNYIVKVRDGANGAVSFSAPGRVLNLGDSDSNVKTQYIALQTAIKNFNGDYNIITQYGDGNFPNSFSAGTGNGGSTAISTYYTDATNQGVVVHKNLRLGTEHGPYLKANSDSELIGAIPYVYISDGEQITTELGFKAYYGLTTSLFRDLSKKWSASLNLWTEGEFFVFQKPVESESFSIKSEQYKTRLIENTLFLNDGAFLEGLSDGIRYAGNAYFDGNLTSQTFASGFAGRGFGIVHDLATGSYAATFDELTVRKKLRAYELEVQKISATNGSLWVSDSCSGDEVIQVN